MANKIIGDTAPIPDVFDSSEPATPEARPAEAAQEFGGRPGLDPTRYGDWEKNGRCIDF